MNPVETHSNPYGIKTEAGAVAAERYVIARAPNGGIGDHLSCLVGAWWFAKRTRRTLVVDWRGSRFSADPSGSSNCFTDFFCHRDIMEGVEVISDQSVSEMRYDGPFFPAKWNRENLAATCHVKHTQEEVDEINRLVTSSEDRPEPTVAFNQWIHPAPPKNEVRSLLRVLQFAEPIRAAADEVWQRSVPGGSALAVHIRHGNGENIGARAAYWLDPIRFFRQLRLNASADIHRAGTHGRFADNMPESLIRSLRLVGSESRFLQRVCRAVRRMQQRTANATPILFCDAQAVADEFVRTMPGAVVLGKYFRKPNAGPLHALPVAHDEAGHASRKLIFFEMAVEMELMRRCSGLVCMDSGFSILSKALIDDERIFFLRPTLVNRLIARVFRTLR